MIQIESSAEQINLFSVIEALLHHPPTLFFYPTTPFRFITGVLNYVSEKDYNQIMSAGEFEGIRVF